VISGHIFETEDWLMHRHGHMIHWLVRWHC